MIHIVWHHNDDFIVFLWFFEIFYFSLTGKEKNYVVSNKRRERIEDLLQCL